MLTVQPIAAFSDNYIWLITREGETGAFVVDPGDASVVEQALESASLDLAGILITHHHFDHVGGLAELRARYQPVVYGPDNPAIEGLDHVVRHGDRVNMLGAELHVMEVPGHTLDHIAYFMPGKEMPGNETPGEEPLVFCGDTLFAGGCGRLFEGTPKMMHASLSSLAELPANTRIYCAHEYTLANLSFARAVEPQNSALQLRIAAAEQTRAQGEPTVPSTLALELDTNPFVRCESPALQAALRAQGKLENEDPVEVFASIRGWKDNF